MKCPDCNWLLVWNKGHTLLYCNNPRCNKRVNYAMKVEVEEK